MTVKTLLIALAALAFGVALIGCGDDGKYVSDDDVRKADEARAKAIDDDPNMTPEDKAKMKEMLFRGRDVSAGQRGGTK